MAHLVISSKDIRTLDGLYSLNDLHVVSGASLKHKPANFMRLETTQELIAEIDRCSDLSNTFKSMRGGADKGTWVCKELVYAYAMWISPKFNLEVIRAFDQAQQPEPQLPAPESLDKYQILNNIARSMGIEQDIAILPAVDVMGLVNQLRHYQRQIAIMKPTCIGWMRASSA